MNLQERTRRLMEGSSRHVCEFLPAADPKSRLETRKPVVSFDWTAQRSRVSPWDQEVAGSRGFTKTRKSKQPVLKHEIICWNFSSSSFFFFFSQHSCSGQARVSPFYSEILNVNKRSFHHIKSFKAGRRIICVSYIVHVCQTLSQVHLRRGDRKAAVHLVQLSFALHASPDCWLAASQALGIEMRSARLMVI